MNVAQIIGLSVLGVLGLPMLIFMLIETIMMTQAEWAAREERRRNNADPNRKFDLE